VSEPGSVNALRVGDADRGAVVEMLTRAHAEGRLDLAEHSDRSDRALTARTVGDLLALVEDLTPARIPQAALPAPRGSGAVRATLGSTRRAGAWMVPETLHVSVLMGDAKIDMTEAVFTHPVVELDVSIIMGDVKLYVPAGLTVIDECTHIMSDFKIKGMLQPAQGAPTIIVKGSSIMGDVKVRVRPS